jgi:hypothetical protein
MRLKIRSVSIQKAIGDGAFVHSSSEMLFHKEFLTPETHNDGCDSLEIHDFIPIQLLFYDHPFLAKGLNHRQGNTTQLSIHS